MPSKPLQAIKPMFKHGTWRIVEGDLVQIMAGKDKGKQGKVLKVIRDLRFPRVLVENLNLVKRHLPKQRDMDGMVISMEAPLHYSNVQVVDPETKKPVRVALQHMLKNGVAKLVRVAKGTNASGAVIPYPKRAAEPLPNSGKVGSKDTPKDSALASTYDKTQPIPFRLPAWYQTKLPEAAAFDASRRRFSSNVAYVGSSNSGYSFAAIPLLYLQHGLTCTCFRQKHVLLQVLGGLS